MKIRHGAALPIENPDEDVISFPGLNGKGTKRITFRKLAAIIQCPIEDIFRQVQREIIFTGLENEITGGIVLTGGGALLKNIEQVSMNITGMNTRIGYPGKNLDPSFPEEIISPRWATAIGLVEQCNTIQSE